MEKLDRMIKELKKNESSKKEESLKPVILPEMVKRERGSSELPKFELKDEIIEERIITQEEMFPETEEETISPVPEKKEETPDLKEVFENEMNEQEQKLFKEVMEEKLHKEEKVKEKVEKEEKEKVSKLKEELVGPVIVKDAFLTDNGFFAKIKRNIPFIKKGFFLDNKGNKISIKKTLKEPILFLMKDDGFTETLENIRPGEFVMKTRQGEKSINLSPDKLTSWKYGGQYYKTWFAYENCMSPYPENPLHNAEMYRKTVTKVSLNYKDRDEQKLLEGRGKMWLLIMLGGAVALVLLASTPAVKELLFGAQQAAAPIVEQAAATTVEAVKANLTSGVSIN